MQLRFHEDLEAREKLEGWSDAQASDRLGEVDAEAKKLVEFAVSICEEPRKFEFFKRRVEALQTSTVDLLVGNFQTVEQLKAGIDAAPARVKHTRVFALHNTSVQVRAQRIEFLDRLLVESGRYCALVVK